MKTFVFKIRILFMLASLFSLGAQAQTYKFIYIQTENKQPFYVKMDKKVLNSSKTGYMIISKLVESEYKLFIGFPEKGVPEYLATIKVGHSNAGYLLNKTAKNEWELFNLLSLKTLVLHKLDPVIEVEEFVVTDNEFAKVLAQVVNDPSIAWKVIVKKVTIPVQPAMPEIITEKTETEAIGFKKADNIDPTAESAISKIDQKKTKDGVLITYVDKGVPVVDTVKVLLPIPESESEVEKLKSITTAQTAAGKEGEEKTVPGFIDMVLKNPNQKIDTANPIKDDMVITEKKTVFESKSEVQAETKSRMINSDCKRIASENDFLDIRKKMAAKDNEADMLKLANKQFLKSCFTSEQIKNLSVLFIKEEEKYKFFIAAYPHVSDSHNFGSLEDQLTDNYYQSRFKAMVAR